MITLTLNNRDIQKEAIIGRCKNIWTELPNGQKHGTHYAWYPIDNTKTEPKLMFEHNYSSGQLHGVSRSWSKNGQMLTENYYVSGQPHGISRRWHKNGQLRNQDNYLNGKKNGISITRDENGRLMTEDNYVNDQKHGACTTYYSESTFNAVQSVYMYSEGKLHGQTKGWYINGQPKYTCDFQHGQKHGQLHVWNVASPESVIFSQREKNKLVESGQLLYLENYCNGVKHGVCRAWYPVDPALSPAQGDSPGRSTVSLGSVSQLWYEYRYSNGVLDGVCKDWYRINSDKCKCCVGQIHREYNYYNGKKHGVCKKTQHKLNHIDVKYTETYYLNGKPVTN